MSEEEMLGVLAHETYMRDVHGHDGYWDTVDELHRHAWIAAAKAVAERVLQELQAANEASGA